jgi:hypothetical protein
LLFSVVTMGGVVAVGYVVFQTAQHAKAAVSSFKGRLPILKPGTSRFPGGLKPPAGRPGSGRPTGFPFFPTPGASGTRPFPYLPVPRPGQTGRYPTTRPVPPFGVFRPGRR